MRSISWIRIALLSAVLTWITSNFWVTRARRSALKKRAFSGPENRPFAQTPCLRAAWWGMRSASGQIYGWRAMIFTAPRGANQLLSASAALAALEALRARLPVSARDIRLGLANIHLPGRFQVLPGRPTVVLDVAHNPHAVAALTHNLDQMGFFPETYAVFGAMRDKDIAGMLRCMKGAVQHWHLTDLPAPRAAPAVQIKALLHEMLPVTQTSPVSKRARMDIRCFTNAVDAYSEARARAKENDRIVAFGSFYTVAAVMMGLGPVLN